MALISTIQMTTIEKLIWGDSPGALVMPTGKMFMHVAILIETTQWKRKVAQTAG